MRTDLSRVVDSAHFASESAALGVARESGSAPSASRCRCAAPFSHHGIPARPSRSFPLPGDAVAGRAVRRFLTSVRPSVPGRIARRQPSFRRGFPAPDSRG